MLGDGKLSEKGQRLGFVGHSLSVPTLQLCCGSAKATIDNMETSGHGCLFAKPGGEAEFVVC